MDDAKVTVRQRLGQVKSFLAQEGPPRLSESDTKANFIEPVIAALGWEGIGVVTREYYVKNSQEFIDYVMAGPGGPLLAIEAKPLQADLTDKHAAQLIQYCAVEGIEWAALTNGRELQFFNTFLKPDLAAKRVLRLDLLAFNTDAEYDALFEQVWQLSRESMTKPTGVRTWLNQRRLDAALRAILLNPGSSTLRHLRKALDEAEVRATPQDLAQWFRSHLGTPIASLPIPATQVDRQRPVAQSVAASDAFLGAQENRNDDAVEGSVVARATPQATRLYRALQEAVARRIPAADWRVMKYYAAAADDGHTFLAVRFRSTGMVLGMSLPQETSDRRLGENAEEFRWGRITKAGSIRDAAEVDDGLLALIETAHRHATGAARRSVHYGVGLRDLVASGALPAGTPLVLVAKGGREAATPTLSEAGEIMWQGRAYRSPSDMAFAPLLGVTKFNGWEYWRADHPGGRQTLAAVRASFLGGQNDQAELDASCLGQ